jgi:hypothetical protein
MRLGQTVKVLHNLEGLVVNVQGPKATVIVEGIKKPDHPCVLVVRVADVAEDAERGRPMPSS